MEGSKVVSLVAVMRRFLELKCQMHLEMSLSLEKHFTSFLDDVKCFDNAVHHHWSMSLKCLRGIFGILSRGQVKDSTNYCNNVLGCKYNKQVVFKCTILGA